MGVYFIRIFLPGQPLTYTRRKIVLCQTRIIGSMISQDIMDVMFDISNPPKKKKKMKSLPQSCQVEFKNPLCPVISLNQ